MKRILCIFAVAFFIAASCIAGENKGGKMGLTITEKAATNLPKTDLDGVMKAIGYYIQAAVDGSSKTAEKGFALWATMSWNENGKLVTVPIQALYDYFDEKKRPASGEIVACEIATTIATVRLESDFDGASFTDMFTLVKDGDSWKIASKVYHLKK